MILLDSNVVIYSTQAAPEFDAMRQHLLDNLHCVSLITYVEVLGFHEINEKDKATLSEFFEVTPVLSVTVEIAAQAIRLRQKQRMKLVMPNRRHCYRE